MPQHRLKHIDPEKKTATCSICGSVTVELVDGPSGAVPMCGNTRRRYKARRKIADPKPPTLAVSTSHWLSDVDDEAQVATCSICGRVNIRVYRGANYTLRSCANAHKARQHKSRQRRVKHNNELLVQYKLACGCARCGYREYAVALELHRRGRDPKPSTLAAMQTERFLRELETCEVLCANCHRVVDKTSVT